MHILVVSQFFHPEMGAPAARFGDFGRYWLEAGHRITVLSTWPNAPRGLVYEGHQQRPWAVEDIGGIRVIRTPVLALGGYSPGRKALLYATFAASALMQGALRNLRPDIVIGTTPPPTVGYVSLLLARRFGVPHVLDVRDIWPEAVLNAGRVQASVAVATLERLNGVVLRRSAAITTVSEGKRTRLLELGAKQGHVHVIPNGVDLDRFDREATESQAETEAVLRKAGVPAGATLVTYAGVFNPPQGLDLVLDVAQLRLRRPADPVHFLLIGDGELRTHLGRRVAAEGLTNVHISGPVPRALVAPIYRRSWASVVILRPRKDAHTVPSKLYECMATRRPVLLSADGEAADLAAAARCGPISRAGDIAGLQRGIDALLADPVAARSHGLAGRAYVEANNDRAGLSQLFLEVLCDAVAR